MQVCAVSKAQDACHHGRYGSDGQLCRETEAALVASLQWPVLGLFCCDDSVRAVFPSLVDRPRVLGIMAGMAQKDSYAAGFAPVPLVVDRPKMLRVLVGMTRRTVTQRALLFHGFFKDGIVVHLLFLRSDGKVDADPRILHLEPRP